MYGGFRDLKVFNMAYELAMRIFDLSRSFPAEEKYALTDQIRRSSRSVCANIAEGYRKRQCEAAFCSRMSDADAEATETQVWLQFALDCKYLDAAMHKEMTEHYIEVGRMLGGMIAHPEKFKPKVNQS